MPRSHEFRREWSLTALAATALRPADVTIINTSGHGSAFTRALANTLRLRRRPYVAMIGGLHATATGVQREYFEEACAVAVHNYALRDQLIAAGLQREKLVVVRLGVDTNHFAPPEPADGPEQKPTLLYVGRLIELKGVDRLIRAVAAVRVRHPTVLLDIVGPASDPTYLSRLRQLVAELSLEECVRFRGVIAYDALPAHYGSASLLVLPSVSEGFGMVVVESLACGTPVLALKNSGGPPDIITDGEDGRLVEESELGSEISTLLADSLKLSGMRRAARNTALERFSNAVTNRSFEDLVARALVSQ